MNFNIKENWPLVAAGGVAILGIVYLRNRGGSTSVAYVPGAGNAENQPQQGQLAAMMGIAQLNNQAAMHTDDVRKELGIYSLSTARDIEQIRAQGIKDVANINANAQETSSWIGAGAGVLSLAIKTLFSPGGIFNNGGAAPAIQGSGSSPFGVTDYSAFSYANPSLGVGYSQIGYENMGGSVAKVSWLV